MNNNNKNFLLDIPIEKALKKYIVTALQENHVRAFSRKKDPS